MKFTLKDYQEEAVVDVLSHLRKAAKRWHEDGDKHAFSLTATTGAGKTVMAASAFEALFHGDDNYDFEADPGAVVIWFSDDPSLNEQTRFRLLEASDRLRFSDLVVVESTFSQEKLEPGKIYFLNTQKLSKKALLVRGHEPEDWDSADQESLFEDIRPDLRSHTIWDTIRNTIEDPTLTLYLVLDEAHRGMGKATMRNQANKSTIVKRLINGAGSIPAIPVVWGISATVDRFNHAMAGAKGRGILPEIRVDSAKVQDSGLLKDTIILDIPDEVGKFDTVLVRRATDKIIASTKAWIEYAQQQEDAELVVPLMVLQLPNKPKPDDVGRALDTIFQQWSDLGSDAIAHVLGEHKAQTFGSHTVPYISPERVEETTSVKVLIAKDAISTGWDCPRAEVMVSFRPAKDRTHITQLLGRMVRTPLARRIPGSDVLNSVDCLLPFFDKKSVEAVADALMKGGSDVGDDPLPGRRVLINPVEMVPNPTVDDNVWDAFVALPSQSLPQKAAKPIKRLTALAHELSADELVKGAGKKAHKEMHKTLDAAKARYSDEIKEARKAVLTVEGKSLKADLQGNKKSFDDFLEEADLVVIEDAFRRASRGISPDIARTYAEHIADNDKEADTYEDALIEAHADIAAFGLIPSVQNYLEAEADKLAKQWMRDHRVAIKHLSDERQEVYRLLKSWSKDPQDVDLVKPHKWIVQSTILEDGIETSLPTFKGHLMSYQEDELFPSDLNPLEKIVLEAEMGRESFRAWYRNPSRGSQDSLGIAYSNSSDFSIVRPDFVFFSLNKDKSIAVDIVDPHSHHLADALPKLKGLAQYAETHAKHYRRIEGVSDLGGNIRVLDLTDKAVRKEILKAENAKSLYESEVAYDYK